MASRIRRGVPSAILSPGFTRTLTKVPGIGAFKLFLSASPAAVAELLSFSSWNVYYYYK